jgi:hypothetical protein
MSNIGNPERTMNPQPVAIPADARQLATVIAAA